MRKQTLPRSAPILFFGPRLRNLSSPSDTGAGRACGGGYLASLALAARRAAVAAGRAFMMSATLSGDIWAKTRLT